MALTTDRDGMRKALDAMRIGRDPGIASADFILPLCELGWKEPSWGDYGVRQGDQVQWMVDHIRDTIQVRVILRQEAPPTFVDLMAA